MNTIINKLCAVLACFWLSLSLNAQLVTNGSITGSPCANSGINNGYAAGWSGCGFSPDLCCLTMPSYVTTSQVTPVVSPDGGTWLGLAALGECARTTITGLTAGTTYTLYFCGACFGTGTSIYNSGPSKPRIIVGTSTFVPTIPMVASTWNKYSMTFVASAATMTLQCDHPTGSVSYASLDGFSLSSTAVCKPIVLPIELVDFTPSYNKDLKQVDLEWTVSMEKNVSYYGIEKSDDATVFQEIEKVYAAYGDHYSLQRYMSSDKHALPGKVNYYRLVTHDKDGKFTYSPTKSVYYSEPETELNIIPNPAYEKATLYFTSPNERIWTVTVFDKEGKKAMEFEHYATAGVNTSEIELRNLNSGLYFVCVSDGDMFYKKKLIKN